MKKKYITELAKTYNNLDESFIADLLSEDIIYESQNVLTPIEGKENLLYYLKNKFKRIKELNSIVFAEIGFLNDNSCIILSQDEKENKSSLVLIEINNNLISRIDLCTVAPHWSSAKRIGEYPI
jgi:hypothetical protein